MEEEDEWSLTRHDAVQSNAIHVDVGIVQRALMFGCQGATSGYLDRSFLKTEPLCITKRTWRRAEMSATGSPETAITSA